MQQQIEQYLQKAHGTAHGPATRQTSRAHKLTLTSGLFGLALVGATLCSSHLAQAVAQTAKVTAVPTAGSTPLGHSLNLTKDGRIVTDNGELILQIPSTAEAGAIKGEPKVLAFKVVDGKVVNDGKVVFAPVGKSIVIGKDGIPKFQVFTGKGIGPLENFKGNVEVLLLRRIEVVGAKKETKNAEPATTEKKAEKVAPATKKPSAPLA